MKEHSIIFSGEMVRAILDGRKTQTRRLIHKRYIVQDGSVYEQLSGRKYIGNKKLAKCPYGQQGDRLWVRETWCSAGDGSYEDIFYKANGEIYGAKWKPSIHIPRWASRLTLEITDIRVEQLRDITEEDAKAEGVDQMKEINSTDYRNYLWHGLVGDGITQKQSDNWEYQYSGYELAKDSFSSLWNSIHKKENRWEDNPWVWVIEFKRV